MRAAHLAIASVLAILALGSAQSGAQRVPHVEPVHPYTPPRIEPMRPAPRLEPMPRIEPAPDYSYTPPARAMASGSRCPLNRMPVGSSTDPTGGGSCQVGGSSDVTPAVGSCEHHTGDYVFPDTNQHARHGDGIYCRGPRGWYFLR